MSYSSVSTVKTVNIFIIKMQKLNIETETMRRIFLKDDLGTTLLAQGGQRKALQERGQGRRGNGARLSRGLKCEKRKQGWRPPKVPGHRGRVAADRMRGGHSQGRLLSSGTHEGGRWPHRSARMRARAARATADEQAPEPAAQVQMGSAASWL